VPLRIVVVQANGVPGPVEDNVEECQTKSKRSLSMDMQIALEEARKLVDKKLVVSRKRSVNP